MSRAASGVAAPGTRITLRHSSSRFSKILSLEEKRREETHIEVLELLYQPEAAGEYHR
ncbi:Regulator of nucleoside diphosphate kinase [Cronobacter dublinensis 582]|nr:Regulator of nucleoside diphosphate kinase [Cronobacter dublinensis 582]